MLVRIQFAEIEGLYEDSYDCCAPCDDHFELVILGDEEDDEKVYAEDIGVYFEEAELNLVVNHLHPVVIVDVHLVLHVEVDERYEDYE